MWTLGGLPLRELLRRTWHESWTDAVWGQAGRMAFYHFLAIFPSLLIFLTLAGSLPAIGTGVKITASGVIQDVLPSQAAGLFHQMMAELQRQRPAGLQFLSACAGALWAVMNGTWALIFGLNMAYEVTESRSWWKLAVTLTGLTAALTAAGVVALLLLFSARQIEGNVFEFGSPVLLRSLEWLAVVVLLMISFAIVYRFAPNLPDAEWRWSTPGSACALVLWLASTLGLRFYFEHINNYHRSYGHLNTVVMLLLWLYFTNAAILIGGEMNSEIRKAVAGDRNQLQATEASSTARA
jgi:membrane protein